MEVITWDYSNSGTCQGSKEKSCSSRVKSVKMSGRQEEASENLEKEWPVRKKECAVSEAK